MSLSFSAGVSAAVVSAVRASAGIAASAAAAGIISTVVTTGGISAVIAAGISTVITARIRAGRRGFRFAAGTEAIGVGVRFVFGQDFLTDAALPIVAIRDIVMLTHSILQLFMADLALLIVMLMVIIADPQRREP